MDWLNYHHLLYFWTVAREGGLRPAAEALNVSQPSISAQLRSLEEAVGEPLFRKTGRSKSLTKTGNLVYSYAEEIFSIGRELQNALSGKSGGKRPRLLIGAADSFPKLVMQFLLRPVTHREDGGAHIICREGKLEDLLAQLATHRLDIVLADEPAPGNLQLKAFSHKLGTSSITFCAAGNLGDRLASEFPHSLDGAPALLPTKNTPLRRDLNYWFSRHGIRPTVVGEFEDSALMKVMATEGRGFTVVPAIIAQEASSRYGLRSFGEADDCQISLYAITAERRITNEFATAITESAKANLEAAAKT